MTRKRYQKLVYALLQEINKEHTKLCGKSAGKWGRCLKSVQRIKYGSPDTPKLTNYAEAWESLKPIRELYGM